METRLIFAIAMIFTSGLFNFVLKIAAEKNYNISVVNFYSYLTMTCCLWIYLIFNFQRIDFSNIYIILILAFLNGLFYFLSTFSRVESMKNIDTVIFFPLYKTFWPVIVTLISLFIFNESLEIKEIIWIIIWILVPLSLITNIENKRQKNLYLGIIFVIITAILTAITAWISKEITIQNYSFILFLFFSWCFWFLFSILSYQLFDKKKENQSKWIRKISIVMWVTHLFSFISFMLALKWNLAIVFTIWSFNILIPIILSIIFFNDHFNFRKWLVIALSIISIILFI
jgi:drug/metabolite transporter (DMT)-like permease